MISKIEAAIYSTISRLTPTLKLVIQRLVLVTDIKFQVYARNKFSFNVP